MIALVNPTRAASRMRLLIPDTGLISPAKPISPKAMVWFRLLLAVAEAMARAVARSVAGSVIFTPPTVDT